MIVDKEFVRQIIHDLGLERKIKYMPNILSTDNCDV